MRFALCRHSKQELSIDIIKDTEFNEANRIYEAQCVELKKQGLAKTEHKPPIADEDIKKLYRCGVFNTENPTTLQNKVFFEIMLFFCRRGRQNLHQLKKTDFEIKVNSQGKRCVVKTTDELTKNHSTRRSSWRRRNDDSKRWSFLPGLILWKIFECLESNEWIPFSATKVIWWRRNLVWQHGCRRQHSRQEDESHLTPSGVLNNIHK